MNHKKRTIANFLFGTILGMILGILCCHFFIKQPHISAKYQPVMNQAGEIDIKTVRIDDNQIYFEFIVNPDQNVEEYVKNDLFNVTYDTDAEVYIRRKNSGDGELLADQIIMTIDFSKKNEFELSIQNEQHLREDQLDQLYVIFNSSNSSDTYQSGISSFWSFQ